MIMKEKETKSVSSGYFAFLAKNIFWLQLSHILTRVCSLLALPIITMFLAPEAFGIIALFMVEASFLSGFYGLGLVPFAMRMIYKYDHKDKEVCNQYLGIILFYIIIFSFLGAIISLPFVRLIKEVIFKDVFFAHTFLFYIPVVQAFFLTIYGFTNNSFLNLQENKKIFICDIFTFLLLIPAEIVGLVWFDFTWVEVVVLQLIVQIIVTTISLWLLRTRLGFSLKRLKIIKQALKYSLPFIAMNVNTWIQQQIDKIFLGRIHAMSFVGIYTVGLKISEGYQFFSRPIATSVKPEISKRFDARHKEINRDIGDFFTIFFQFSLFLIFSLSIFSKEIIDIFTDVKYSAAFKIVPLAMLGYMCSEMSGIFQLKAIYRNKTIFFGLITFLGAILNALLNYALIPKYGIVGAASSTALANLIILFVWYAISQKLHFSKYHMVKNFSVFVLVATVIFLIQYLLPHSSLMIFLKCALIICYGIILFKHSLHTNKRFSELKDIFVEKLNSLLR